MRELGAVVVTCSVCGGEVVAAKARYCSAKCRERAKYERGKASGSEARRRALRNARYVPHPLPRSDRRCDALGCERPHLALGFCKAHYARHKAYDRRKHTYKLLGGLVCGRAVRVVCERAPFGGMWAWCPNCGAMLGIEDGSNPSVRVCAPCGLPIFLNPEELQFYGD